MGIKKTLTGIVLTTALAAGLGGCSFTPGRYAQYDINTYINGTWVHFASVGRENDLHTYSKDKTSVWYDDNRGNDLKVDEVHIQVSGGKEEVYKNKSEWPDIFAQAQKNFDSYMTEIMKYKLERGYEAIGKN